MNYVLQGDGFYVSFNPDTSSLMFGAGNGPETALVTDDDTWFILDGDFREAYAALVPKGLDACKRFYDLQARAGHRSEFSTTQAF